MISHDNTTGLTLAFDTSSRVLDVVLTDGNEHARYRADAGRRHNELLTSAIRDLLEQWRIRPQDLDGLVCCGGPGSFTGLRIGIATAKGISAAHGIPVYAVPTLTAYRWASNDRLVISAIDGRKRRFYAELFDGNLSMFGPVDAEPGHILEAMQALTTQEFNPFPEGDGSRIQVVGPDSEQFIHEIETLNPVLAGRLRPDPGYYDGVAHALVECVRGAANEAGRFLLDDAAGPEYLRPSQAEE